MELIGGRYLMTLKDVAFSIAPQLTDAAFAKAMRQVRHWTQHDLLRTVSQKSTGSGIPRLYEEEPTLEIAAILAEIARYGATIDILKPVADALYEDWHEGGFHMANALTDEGHTYLQVSWREDPATGALSHASTNLFTQFEHTHEDEGALSSAPTSSILIQLNKIMDRVRFPRGEEWAARLEATGGREG